MRVFFAIAASLCPITLAAVQPPKEPPGRAEAHRRHGLDPATALESRAGPTHTYILELFRRDGLPTPKHHELSRSERQQLVDALEILPPVHRGVLRERLRTMSFLDDMPNTALTSTVDTAEPFRLFDITVNASILGQNVSEWLTQKERTCYDNAGSALRVSVDAGTKLNALAYVLLHESTHIVDSVLRITPPILSEVQPVRVDASAGHPFTEGTWVDLSMPKPPFRDPSRERVRFYAGNGTIPIAQAQEVYESLRRTPFVSLYGGRNWLDDLAEYLSVYHLTEVLKQPYRIVIRRGDDEAFVYEPMKSPLVRGRIEQMKRFYQGA
jgi:hypothetical protein